MQTPRGRSPLLTIGLLMLLPIALLQLKLIDPLRAQPAYNAGQGTVGTAASKLPVAFAVGALTGFREAIAGLLWVRTDEFFHNGDYEAITPMIRIITWLDPHNVDVYETGAWHMDYNFTDTDQRSDRRYIPLSIALLNEGIANNPTVPDLFKDLGFTHYYRKIADFPMARQTFARGQALVEKIKQDAQNHPGDSELQAEAKDASTDVTTISHGLAHALEATGDIPGAEKQWQYCIDAHKANLATLGQTDYGEKSGLETSQKQLYEMQQRVKWRARDTKAPLDMKFDPELVRVAPKVFVVRGTLNAIGSTKFVLETGQAQWGPVDGCRVEVRLQDAGYTTPRIASFSLSSLNLDPNVTIMQDAVSVRGGKIGGDKGRKIDMSKDPDMYSFTAPRYTVTFWFNPANPNDCPPNVQDRVGWLGEALTGAGLDTSGIVPGDTTAPIPGLRQYKKTITLTREDLLGQGEKVFK